MPDKITDVGYSMLNRFPSIVGKAVVETCLSSFPLHLLVFNILRSVADEAISIRNEKQVIVLLNGLSDLAPI